MEHCRDRRSPGRVHAELGYVTAVAHIYVRKPPSLLGSMYVLISDHVVFYLRAEGSNVVPSRGTMVTRLSDIAVRHVAQPRHENRRDGLWSVYVR
jgi:hypothetical protein